MNIGGSVLEAIGLVFILSIIVATWMFKAPINEKLKQISDSPTAGQLDKISRYIDEHNRYERVWFDGMERAVRITAYSPSPNQTDSRHWETASGTKVRTQGIALSRDLLTNYGGGPFSMGDTVFVVVPFIIDDTMHKRNKNRADILLERKYAARMWGIKNAWIIE